MFIQPRKRGVSTGSPPTSAEPASPFSFTIIMQEMTLASLTAMNRFTFGASVSMMNAHCGFGALSRFLWKKMRSPSAYSEETAYDVHSSPRQMPR